MTDRSTSKAVASRRSALTARVSAFAVGAALVAALLVPMIVMVLAGASLDAHSIDGPAAGDAAGTASAAVGGAQRLLAGARAAVPVALPTLACAPLTPADLCTACVPGFEPEPIDAASGDAASSVEASRRF